MKAFNLVRTEDVSGVSGTGTVAEGALFSDGTCVIRWLSKHPSTNIYNSLEQVEQIHGHEGRTKVVMAEQEAS